jgi:hypothetical protein
MPSMPDRNRARRSRAALRTACERLEGRTLPATIQLPIFDIQTNDGGIPRTSTYDPANSTISTFSSYALPVYIYSVSKLNILHTNTSDDPSAISSSNLNFAFSVEEGVAIYAGRIGPPPGQKPQLSFGTAGGAFVDVNILPSDPEEIGKVVTIELTASRDTKSLPEQYPLADDGAWQSSVTYKVGTNTPPLPLLAASDIPLNALVTGLTPDSSNSVKFEAKVGQSFQIAVSALVAGAFDSPMGSGSMGHLQLGISILRSKPDVAVTSVKLASESDGGVDVNYTIDSPLTVPAPFALRWLDAAGNVVGSPITTGDNGLPLTSLLTPNTPGVPYTLHISSARLGPPPPGAVKLEAVADITNAIEESREDNNTASLTLPDIAVQSIQWHPSTADGWSNDPANAGGVDIGYTISGPDDLPQGAPVAVYWTDAEGNKLNPDNPITRGKGGVTLVTQTAQNTSAFITVPASQLGTPPKGAVGLLAVIDPTSAPSFPSPAGLIPESDEMNNSNPRPLDASRSAILRGSVHYSVSDDGYALNASFMPAEGNNPPPRDQPPVGALTLPQAAAICGVDRFNWVQHLEFPDGYEHFYRFHGTDQSDAIESPMLDPDDVVTDASQITLVSDLADRGEALKSLPVDQWPFYWSEPIDNEYKNYYNIDKQNSYILNFRDVPAQPDDFLKESDYWSFTTNLVGVKVGIGDPPTYSQVDLRSPGDLTIRWKSNTVYDHTKLPKTPNNGGVFLYSVDESALPPDLSGGIFDVQVGDQATGETPLSLSPVTNQTVEEGGTLSFTAQATGGNADRTLTYSLDPGSPPGATIDPNTGAFSWDVPASEPPGNYSVTVRVTDNSSPPATDAKTFTITVASSQQPTSLSPVSGSGTFGGTATLSATLTSNGSPLAGKIVTFTLNNGGTVTTLGTATTDANGVATLTGASLAGITAGAYPGAVGASFAQDANDAATSATGDLTVGKATPSLSWANPADLVYGTPLGASQLDATASVPGTFAYAPAAGTILHAGRGQALKATFTPADTADFVTATATVLIDVAPAPLTITADDKTLVAGTALPALSASYSGFVNGDGPANLATPVTLTTAATPGSPAGTYAIMASGAASPDYTITFSSGTLTVTPAPATSPSPTTTPPASITGPRAAFVATLYNDVLGRNPEPAGLRYWVRRLAVGKPALDVARGIWTSPEHRSLVRSGVAPRIGFWHAFADALRAGRAARLG